MLHIHQNTVTNDGCLPAGVIFRVNDTEAEPELCSRLRAAVARNFNEHSSLKMQCFTISDLSRSGHLSDWSAVGPSDLAVCNGMHVVVVFGDDKLQIASRNPASSPTTETETAASASITNVTTRATNCGLPLPAVLTWSHAEKTYRKKTREHIRELAAYKQATGATSMPLLQRRKSVATIREAVANVRAYNAANPNRFGGSKTYIQHNRFSQAARKDPKFVEDCDLLATKRFARADVIARTLLGQAVNEKQSGACKKAWTVRRKATEAPHQHQHHQHQLTQLPPQQQQPSQPMRPPVPLATSPCFIYVVDKSKKNKSAVEVNICQMLALALHNNNPKDAVSEILNTFVGRAWQEVARVLGFGGKIPTQRKFELVKFVFRTFVSTAHVAACPKVLAVCGDMQIISSAKEWFDANVDPEEVADATAHKRKLPPAKISGAKVPRVATKGKSTPVPVADATQIAHQAASAAVAVATKTLSCADGGQ